MTDLTQHLQGSAQHAEAVRVAQEDRAECIACFGTGIRHVFAPEDHYGHREPLSSYECTHCSGTGREAAQ